MVESVDFQPQLEHLKARDSDTDAGCVDDAKRANRIMVVDDSPTALRSTGQMLAAAGYDVALARDGQEAIEIAAQFRPDAIVLDIILPKKNGYQVCRQIKNNPKTSHIKVLILSSKSQDRDKYWGQKQGANAYVTKPFNDQQLLDQLQSLIHSTAGGSRQTSGAELLRDSRGVTSVGRHNDPKG